MTRVPLGDDGTLIGGHGKQGGGLIVKTIGSAINLEFEMLKALVPASMILK